jgi:hypothetical protein
MINWEIFARKRSWPTLRYYSGIRLTGLRETTKTSFRTDGLRARFEPGIIQIRSSSVNYSTRMFGGKYEVGL